MLDLNYALPDFTAGLKMNLSLIDSWRNDPAKFRDGVRFDSVYDSFPGCKANGGRHYVGQQYLPFQVHATFAALNDAGVKARLTFTNMFIDGRALRDDAYSRMILDIASDYDVEVIVYSDDVADYLRQNYPFKLVLSTTREIADIGTLNDALERYDYVVLNYNLNKDYDFIAQVSHPERIEVMVNELCAPNCPVRQKHYEHAIDDRRFQRAAGGRHVIELRQHAAASFRILGQRSAAFDQRTADVRGGGAVEMHPIQLTGLIRPVTMRMVTVDQRKGPGGQKELPAA